jgi:hypothetical protein
VAIALIAATGTACVVFWPGDMDTDTVVYLHQVLTGQSVDDWHAPVISAVWHLFAVVGLRSPGWVLAGGVMALLVGMYLVLRMRLSRAWALAWALAVFAYPPVLAYAVHIGSDSWVAAFTVCAFGLLARGAQSSGRARAAWLGASVACVFFATAARHNAPPIAFAFGCAATVLLVGGLRPGWRRVLTVVVGGVATTALMVGAVTTLERVPLKAAASHPESHTYVYDLVQLSVRENRDLLPASVYPRDLAYLRRWTTSEYADGLFWGPGAVIVKPLVGQTLRDLKSAWTRAVRDRPLDYLLVRANMTRYQIGFGGSLPLAYYRNEPPPNLPGYPVAFPRLRSAVVKYISVGTPGGTEDAGPLQAVWIYLVVLALGLVRYARSDRRLDSCLAWFAAAGLLYMLGLVFSDPQVDYRYAYPAVVGATLLVVLLGADAMSRLRPAIRTKRLIPSSDLAPK